MKIGLVYYSQTGNTELVAKKIGEKLSAVGHDVGMEIIKIEGKIPAQPGKFTLAASPDLSAYDALIIGAPVQAFTLNPVMKAYLETLPDLAGRQVAIYVTKQLPLLQAGGTGAVAQIKKAAIKQGGQVVGAEIVVWAPKKREQSVHSCVNKICALFSNA